LRLLPVGLLLKEPDMNSIGCDLHKKSITFCVMSPERRVLARRRVLCEEVKEIEAFLREWRPFQLVVEATSSYEWFFQLSGPLAERLVLAHPKKLRIIAESTRKSDRIDAGILAEFLALDMIPEAYRPSPRERAYRRLVRQRIHLKKGIKGARSKIRAILAEYNADRKNLFTTAGLKYLAQVKVSGEDRFVLRQLVAQWQYLTKQVRAMDKRLDAFAESAPPAEHEAREILETIPGVGAVTIDVVLSEFGDIRRFRSQKRACAYAGLSPGSRESDGRRHELRITKEGSPLLRWGLTEAAWRLVRLSRRWRTVFEALAKRRGKKRAITAVARRLLCVMVAMLQRGQRYRMVA
jgi:transposase